MRIDDDMQARGRAIVGRSLQSRPPSRFADLAVGASEASGLELKWPVRQLIALNLLFLTGLTTVADTAAVMPEKHWAVLEKYCIDCHDAETQKGKLDLEALSFEISTDIPTAEHWDNILAALNSKEMPPEDEKQVPDNEKAAFLEDLAKQMVLARNILGDSGGEITMRRMNRREYQNSLAALVGFQPDVSDLPADDDTGGFDTSGASLALLLQ